MANSGNSTSPTRVLITGASRKERVGHRLAVAFAQRKCDLILTHRAGGERGCAEIAAECREHGAKVQLLPLELNSPTQAAAACKAFVQSSGNGRLDVLVHNASWYEPSEFGHIDSDTLGHAMAVNAFSPLLISQALAPLMRTEAIIDPGSEALITGCVLTLGDIHARGELGQPRKGHAAYGISKAALLEVTMILARELAPHVRCNMLAFGVVAFPDAGAEADAQMQQRYLSRVPLGRAGTPADAAAAGVYLALDAQYTTGTVLTVDGGRSIT